MIAVTVVKNGDDYRSIESKGHAGFSSFGKDIVCAAASVLIDRKSTRLNSSH